MPITELADKQDIDKNLKKSRGMMTCVVQLKWHEKKKTKPHALTPTDTKSTSVISSHFKQKIKIFGNVIFKKCREYSLKRVQH